MVGLSPSGPPSPQPPSSATIAAAPIAHLALDRLLTMVSPASAIHAARAATSEAEPPGAEREPRAGDLQRDLPAVDGHDGAVVGQEHDAGDQHRHAGPEG